jgi:hypothetical protein
MRTVPAIRCLARQRGHFPVSQASEFAPELRGILCSIHLLQSSIHSYSHNAPPREHRVVCRGTAEAFDFVYLDESMIRDVLGFTSAPRDRD